MPMPILFVICNTLKFWNLGIKISFLNTQKIQVLTFLFLILFYSSFKSESYFERTCVILAKIKALREPWLLHHMLENSFNFPNCIGVHSSKKMWIMIEIDSKNKGN
jgi:hypothetical protein